MNIKVKIGVFLFMSVLFFTSCDANKKEKVAEKQAVEENVKGIDTEEEVIDQGYEIAMSAYQCPMKCEGDKTYDEEGACPKCNMDLKELDETEESSSDQ